MVKVYIKTYGCSLNHSDSEAIAGTLVQAGHELSSEDDADVVLYNTCTVKNPSQDGFLSELKRRRKPVVVAGCLPQADKKKLLAGYTVLGTERLGDAARAVEAAAAGNILELLEPARNEKRVELPSIRTNPFVEIVPICAGCLSNCTYCKTKQARGNLYSYRPRAIVERVEHAVKDGVKEIWLTSQDNGAYGMDIGTNCAELLKQVCEVEGDFMVRFGMTNPDWTKKWLEPLIEAYKHPKVYKFLHLPIQSGSDAVLKHMKRRCTAEDIKHIVKRFREEIPDITIATDIICGYPTETVEDFEKTVELVRELQFPVIFITKYYARPDTPAAKLKQLANSVGKERSARLTEIFEEEILPPQRKSLVGTTQRVLFTQKKDRTYVGKTVNYTQVILETDDDILGSWQDVEIFSAGLYDLKAVLKKD